MKWLLSKWLPLNADCWLNSFYLFCCHWRVGPRVDIDASFNSQNGITWINQKLKQIAIERRKHQPTYSRKKKIKSIRCVGGISFPLHVCVYVSASKRNENCASHLVGNVLLEFYFYCFHLTERAGVFVSCVSCYVCILTSGNPNSSVAPVVDIHFFGIDISDSRHPAENEIERKRIGNDGMKQKPIKICALQQQLLQATQSFIKMFCTKSIATF